MFLLALGLMSSISHAQELGFAKELIRANPKVVMAQSESQADRSIVIKVIAKMSYANECFVPEEKFKSVSVINEKFNYTLYSSYEAEEKTCMKVFLPVEKEVLVDQIVLTEGAALPKITVNGVPASFIEQ